LQLKQFDQLKKYQKCPQVFFIAKRSVDSNHEFCRGLVKVMGRIQ